MTSGRIAIWILVVSALLFPMGELAAQPRMTIVGGLAVANLSGDGVADGDFEPRNGIHLGIFAELPVFGGRFSVLPGGQYVDKGFTFAEGTAVLKFSYVEVLVPLRFTIPVGGLFGVDIFGGPGVGLGIGCLFKTKDDEVESTTSCEFGDFEFRSIDFTALVGAGLSIPLGGGTALIVNGAFDTSVRSIDDSVAKDDIKNRTWLMQAGVSFPLRAR